MRTRWRLLLVSATPFDFACCSSFSFTAYLVMLRIEEIVISHVRLDPLFLRRILQQEPNVPWLKIGQHTELINPEAIIQVLQSYRKLSALTFDSLLRVNDGDIVAQCLGRLLRFRSSLKRLKFEGCLTEGVGFTAIGEALQQYPHSSLETLEIDDIPTVAELRDSRSVVLSEGAHSLARGIEMSVSLKYLLIEVTRITADGTVKILNAIASSDNLKEVMLSGVEAHAEAWSAITRVLHENDTITAFGLTKSCQSVSVTEPYDFAPLVAALTSNKTMKTFILGRWNFDAPTLRVIVDSLLGNDTISHITYRSSQLNLDTMKELCRLVSNRETRILGLTHNEIGDGELLESLCAALRQSVGLKCLDLSYNVIGDTGAELLADFLLTNPKLGHLHLDEHRLSDQGCMHFGRALETNTKLKLLSLKTSDPQMSLKGIQALVSGMKYNLEVTRLDLPSPSRWPARICRELDVYLERNKVISPLLKAHLPLGLWPHVMKQAHLCNPASPDLLYALVKEKCDLFQSVPITRARKRRRTRR